MRSKLTSFNHTDLFAATKRECLLFPSFFFSIISFTFFLTIFHIQFFEFSPFFSLHIYVCVRACVYFLQMSDSIYKRRIQRKRGASEFFSSDEKRIKSVFLQPENFVTTLHQFFKLKILSLVLRYVSPCSSNKKEEKKIQIFRSESQQQVSNAGIGWRNLGFKLLTGKNAIYVLLRCSF